jgi:hypothetical protein
LVVASLKGAVVDEYWASVTVCSRLQKGQVQVKGLKAMGLWAVAG